ncbi:MAG: hypothetical protein HPY66_0229 [Firmicutes bacterium]|nr:hypothetical protein [Bacillota bacterium]MDI6704652.1 hypothetical protein [Bacillota bacterium]
MRINTSIPRIPIGTVISELFSENEGKTLSAIVASIKDEMILLVFNQRVALQARAKGPLLLHEGQRVELVVSAVTDEEIQLQITKDWKNEGDKTTLTLQKPLQARQMSERPDRRSEGAADRTAGNEPNDRIIDSIGIKTAMKEIKEVIKYKEKLLSSDGVEPEELLNMPLKKLFEIAVGSKVNGSSPNKELNPNKGLEKQDLRFLDELEGVKPDDIKRLIRLDRELNVFNLIIAKTVREGKDFIKPLLKELLRYNNAQTYIDGKSMVFKDSGDGSKVERFEYKNIVNGVVRENAKAKAEGSTALNALIEKASRISRALGFKDCIILPLLYNGECEEALALIKNRNRKKTGGKEAGLHAEVELIIRLANLGEVRAVVSIMDKDLALRFFAEKDYTVRLIDENKGILIEKAGEKGYNIIAVSSNELRRELFHCGDATIDLRV